MDLRQFFKDTILPRLNLQDIYKDLILVDKSRYFTANCPNCNKSNKLVIWKDTGYARCNSCAYKSDVFTYMNGGSLPLGQTYKELYKKACVLAGVTFPERTYSEIEVVQFKAKDREQQLRSDFMHLCIKALHEDGGLMWGQAAREYLSNRGCTLELALQYELGYYPPKQHMNIRELLKESGYTEDELQNSGLCADNSDYASGAAWENRIICPIRKQRDIVNFWARDITGTVEDKYKYKYMSNTYGETYPYRLDAVTGNHAIVVESPFSALMLDAYGIKNVISVGGTNGLGSANFKALQNSRIHTITLVYDNDKEHIDTNGNSYFPGVKGTVQAIERYANEDITILAVPPETLGQVDTDPDELVRTEGPESIQALLDKALYGYVYLFSHKIKELKGEDGWKHYALAQLIETASSFANKITNSKRYIELGVFKQYIRENIPADQDAFDALMQTIEDKKKIEACKKITEKLAEDIHALTTQGNYHDAPVLIFKHADTLKALQDQQATKEVLPANNLIAHQIERLKEHLGKEFIGLCQRTLPELDKRLLGLRELILLAAAPNVGKTTIAMQLCLDTILHNENACMLFVSLEMSREAIFDRMTCNLAKISWETLQFGRYQDYEYKRLRHAHTILEQYGNRILILDKETCPTITVDDIVQHINMLKAKTNCAHVIVAIDYLQVLPTPESLSLKSEIDQDKWRVDQMRQLRDAVDHDPVIIVSQARKPSGSTSWGDELSDVMGSAQASYTPDVAFLCRPLQDHELLECWKSFQLTCQEEEFLLGEVVDDEKKGQAIRNFYEEMGCAITRLRIAKGRDGMRKGTLLLKYYFKESRFEEFNLINEAAFLRTSYCELKVDKHSNNAYSKHSSINFS